MSENRSVSWKKLPNNCMNLKYCCSNSKTHFLVLKSHLFWSNCLEHLNNLLNPSVYHVKVNVGKLLWVQKLEGRVYVVLDFLLHTDISLSLFQNCGWQWSIVLFLIRGHLHRWRFSETCEILSWFLLGFILLKWGKNVGTLLGFKSLHV